MAEALVPAIVSCHKAPGVTAGADQPLTSGWRPDILGDGFEMRYVKQADDYSGNVRSTVVRKRVEGSDRGVLYVHGFNDYFFQSEMADRFVDSCYSFYAVDLRKYGRSILEGQTLFEVRDMEEYFPDIDSAITVMRHDGIDRIVLMGHSTGGLTTSYYMNTAPDPAVKCLVLNSPFLDWHLKPVMEDVAVPAVTAIGNLLPGIKISQGGDPVYSHSLLKEFGGEWSYNTDWKLINSPDVTSGWIHAIESAQEELHKHGHITVPILVMHSDSSYVDGDPIEKASRSDAVLSVDDISRYGQMLGADVTDVTVKGGLHDLALSRRGVRDAMFRYMFSWLHPIMAPSPCEPSGQPSDTITNSVREESLKFI